MLPRGNNLFQRAASLALSVALVSGFLLPAGGLPSVESASDLTAVPLPTAAETSPASTEKPPPTGTPAAEITAAPTDAELATATETPPPTPSQAETSAPPASDTPTPPVTPAPTETPLPYETLAPTATETHTAVPTSAIITPPAATPVPTGTAQAGTPSPTPSPIPAATQTPSPTPTAAFAMGPALPPPAAEVQPAVSLSIVINQVYGGGGNAGAPYLNDFIELFNVSGAPVNVNGWSVQYASATGATWALTTLPDVTLPPGGYLLVQEASGGVNGVPLPAPDVVGTIAMSASAGKVALVSDSTALAGACPAGANIVDFVGYGTTANCSEGGPTGNLSNTTAALRVGADTDDNAADFTVGPPNPRNSVYATPTPAAPLTVVINEVAWGGTAASTTDEWIELYNSGGVAVDLTGWTLASSTDGSPSLTLSGVIPPGGYFLLERTDDNTVADVAADQIYTGDLGNAGEALALRDPLGTLVDTANGDGGAWPAGSGSPGFYAMERTDPALPDVDSNWHGNNGVTRNGLDASGSPINGTPRQANSAPLPTPTPTPSATPTPTPTPTPAPVAYPPQAVVINEVAWAGTAASSSDEWIELYNPGASAISLAGWTLSDGGDVNLVFPALVIGANDFLLLERTDDATVSDIPADLIYTGGLSNNGETLTLRDATGSVVDTANGDGGAWPAGSSASLASMERTSPGPDADSNWHSNYGSTVNGLDADGNPLRATPRRPNSAFVPGTGGATVLLNEFLPHPPSGGQEFIEVFNPNDTAVDLSGWQLDDAEGGTSPYTIPGGTVIQPFALLVFYRSTTGIALNDGGDAARLLRPDGSAADEWAYGRDPGVNVSWARIPDGGAWNARGIPTPGGSNQASPEPAPPTPVPIGTYRQWSDGAWAVVTGRVSVPAPLFGTRFIYIQDDTGGLAVYLGRGDWPPLVVGQSVTFLSYLRHRTGELQAYVRNRALVSFGSEDEAVPVTPLGVSTGQVGEATEGALVRVTGRVVRLESQAFWIDDGSGAARVFFPASTGLRRPRVRRGETWTVTGVVVERTTARDSSPRYRLQPRFGSDVVQLTGAGGAPVAGPTPQPTEPFTPLPTDVFELPTEEPTATAEP